MIRNRRIALSLAAGFLFSMSAFAAAAVLPDAPAPQNQPSRSAASPQNGAATPSHTGGIGDILFPDRFTVDPGTPTQPLTVGQKFRGYAREQLGLSPFLAAAVGGAISQGFDSDPDWGQGWEAYGKRTGDILIEGESVAILREGVIPSILHQDPRYYRRAEGPFISRTFYAITRTLVTRQDSGRPAFNYSVVGACAGGAGLTYAYYPDASQNGSQIAETFGGNIGGIAITNFFREFGPDIKRKLFHRD